MFRIEEIEEYRIIYAFLKSMHLIVGRCIVYIAVSPCSLGKTYNNRRSNLDPLQEYRISY